MTAKPGKSDKSPNAPRRAHSAYLMFTNAYREEVKAKNPGITFAEAGKIIGETWAKMTAAQKEPFEQMAADDKRRYDKEKEAYEAAAKK